MRTLRLLSFFLASCTAAAFAAPAPSAPHWLQIRTTHFTIITNATGKDARHVAAQFERMRAVFQVLMPHATDDPAAPIVVLALKDRASLRALEPAAGLSRDALDLAGLFLRAEDKNYVLLRLDAAGDHPYATVYHEYTHYIFRHTDNWMPLWLSEGLAEFYQNTAFDSKDIRLGKPSVDDILYLRDNPLLPLVTLLAVDYASPYYHDEQKGSVFYAESWALVHYLEVSDFDHQTHLIEDYEHLLRQHIDPVTAAAQVFGDLTQLEQSLNAYIRGAGFKEFHLLTPVNFTEESFTVQPLPTPQADAIRADVLVDDDRPNDAEALLQSVLQADPANPLAHETMGALKFRQNDIPAALDWYSQAVALDSRSFIAHYYFAVLTLESMEHTPDRTHDEAIEQSLRTSIDLNPRFAPAYDALAHFYASRREKLDEAHAFNLKAITLEPDSLAFRENAAEVLAESGKLDDAIHVLKTAQHLAKTPTETQTLDRRLHQLERYQAALAAGYAPAHDSASSNRRPIHIEPSASDEPPYPAGPATGPRHTVSGVIHSVKCTYPAVLTLTLETETPITLYTNNYYKLTPACANLEGAKVTIDYAEVTDPRVSGQILTIALSK